MSRLRICALLRGRPAVMPAGPSGGEIRLLDCGPLVVAAEVDPRELPVSAEALLAHDRVVKLLGDQVDSVLPARFGWIAEESTLDTRLAPHRQSLLDALDVAAGREQMTLRLYGASEAASETPVPAELGPGSGTAYLERKRRETRRRHEVPEIEPLRAALAGLVRAERAERRARGDARDGAFASVHHLVDRGRALEYRRIVTETEPRLRPVRATVSGPWAPYAYAPADLA